jgi:protein-tyrosine phosphatase
MTGNALSRQVIFEGCENFRDLGGYRTSDGRSVRWRRLYRSGHLSSLTDTDVHLARSLGLSTVIDLRTERETKQDGPCALAQDVANFRPIDIFRTLPRGWALDCENWGERFVVMLRDAGVQESLKSAFDVLALEGGLPAVFHCTQGKDRTGLLAALLLGSLGVVDEEIAEDYALSMDFFDLEQLLSRLSHRRKEVGDSDPDRARILDRFIAGPAEIHETRAETILRTLEWLRAEFDSVRSYMIEVGVNEEIHRRLESALLE